MANTTNYNWETPDDTDLVKDGALAIRTLGSSIDTTTKNLNPETTTGDIAYRSATANTNTRLAIGTTGQVLTVAAGVPSWATPTTGDIEGVTAGTGISGGGTSGTVTITNSMATAIDAKGDLVAGTGADAFARLGVGANGTLLTADSSEATGLKWAAPASSGGWTSLGTATLSSSVTSISFTPTGYQQLCLQVINPNSAGAGGFIIKPNGSSTIACMVEDGVYTNTTRNSAQRYKNTIYNGNYNINGNGSVVFYFDLPASTSTVKAFRGTNMVKEGGGDLGFFGYQGFLGTDSALTSFSFEHQGGNFTGGSVEVWGIK